MILPSEVKRKCQPKSPLSSPQNPLGTSLWGCIPAAWGGKTGNEDGVNNKGMCLCAIFSTRFGRASQLPLEHLWVLPESAHRVAGPCAQPWSCQASHSAGPCNLLLSTKQPPAQPPRPARCAPVGLHGEVILVLVHVLGCGPGCSLVLPGMVRGLGGRCL